jgi:hypothetical protein
MAHSARADNIAITLTNPTLLNDGSSTFTLGWQFQTNQSITVTSLGIFVGTDTLVGTHAVGMWASDGTLLGSTNVTSADPVINGFAFHSISPLVLTAGQNFLVGAESDNGDGTSQTFAYNDTALNVSPQITFIQDQFNFGSTLQFPNSSEFGGSTNGFFGGNFQFAPSTVPEPSTLTLLCIGLLSVGGVGWRRWATSVA